MIAIERGTLFGVPLWADRRVTYGRIDPVASRQIFIRSALVERNWRSDHGFLKHNDRVRDEAADLEERSRQRGLVADDDAIFAFTTVGFLTGSSLVPISTLGGVGCKTVTSLTCRSTISSTPAP